jgi:hypothetical protein
VPHFRKGNDRECELLSEVLEKHHPELHAAELIVDVLVAFATKNEQGEPRGPALSHGGYPAIATVRINSLKQRVLGGGDALVTLDGDRWGDFSPPQQRAILDHELTHLELVEGDEGGVEGDDIGRPRLRLRKHDHQFGWFDAVVRRHGANSVEWSQFKAFEGTALKQAWLPGFEAHGGSERQSDGVGDLADEIDQNGTFDEKVEQLMTGLEKRGVKVHRNVVVTARSGVTKTRGRKAAASR